MRQWVILATIVTLISEAAAAQSSPERQRATTVALKAWDYMRAESWPEAAGAFQQAIDIDHEFEDAYHGLGLANMRMKKDAQAIQAYVKGRDLYRAQAGKQFSSPPGCESLSTGSAGRN